MDSKKIGAFLRQLRKTSGLSAKDVTSELAKAGISVSIKTIYAYEKSDNMPNADMFLTLCKIYHCDNPMELLGGTSVAPEESILLEKFRALSPHTQETIRILIDREYGAIIDNSTT